MNFLAFFKRAARYTLPLTVIAALLLVPLTPQNPVRAAGPGDGIVCTRNASASFSLTAQSGSIQIPDGNTVFMWSFSESGKPFQYPGPVLCVTEGDTVTVVLNNTLSEDVSIVFPGQENVLVNGQPVMADPAAATLAGSTASGSVTYTFTASSAGTYLYTSGTNPIKQIQMGLFGMLVVYPTTPGLAYDTASGDLSRVRYNPATEFVSLVSDVDPIFHQKVEAGLNPAVYKTEDAAGTVIDPGILPRYWLINGRSFPDTIAPNFSKWLPSQPYGSMVHINATTNPAAQPPALVRYASVAAGIVPFHPHGANGRMIARDGSLLEGPAGQDMSFEKYSIPLGSGQTWDSLFAWVDVEGYNAQTNPVPVPIPSENNLTIGPYWSGSPYLGNTEPLPPGTVTYNQCGEYYHVAHSHALQQVTSWGITMSGALTVTRIDPPAPNNCP